MYGRLLPAPARFVLEIRGLPTGHKLFSCELKPDGQIHRRAFRRGAWEEQFLSDADAMKAAEVEGGPDAIGLPPGGGKMRAMRSLANAALHDRLVPGP